MNETARFIHLLYGRAPAGIIELAYIREGEPLKFDYAHTPLPEFDETPGIKAANEQGYSCYIGTTLKAHLPKKGRARAIETSHLVALWADIDNTTPDAVLEQVFKLDIPPSITIASGGGVHLYWLLSTPIEVTDSNREDIERLLRGIAICVGGDKVHDLARIMRLPGTVNVKQKYAPDYPICTMVDDDPAYYHLFGLWKQFAPFMPAPLPTIRREVPVTAYSHTLPKFIQNYLNTGAGVGERNHTLHVMARYYNDYGLPLSQALAELLPRACMDGLPEHEVRRTIEKAYTYTPTPRLSRNLNSRLSIGDNHND